MSAICMNINKKSCVDKSHKRNIKMKSIYQVIYDDVMHSCELFNILISIIIILKCQFQRINRLSVKIPAGM